MSENGNGKLVHGLDIPIVKLVPRNERTVSAKYVKRIEASLRAVGLIEPLIVFPQGDNQPPFQTVLRTFMKGTQQPLVSRKDIEDLEIQIPPLSVQEAIVELDDLEVVEQRLLAKLQVKRSQLVQAIARLICTATCRNSRRRIWLGH